MAFSERQSEIIETAMQLILKHGLDGLTTKKIARNIGITEAALYRHFTGKNDILVGILTYFEERTTKLLESVQNSDLPPLQKIHEILKRRAEGFAENAAMMVVVLAEELFPADSALSRKVGGIMQLNRTVIGGLISQCIKDGLIKEGILEEQLFYFIMGPYRFMVTRWRLMEYNFDLPSEFEKLWDGIVKLICK